MYVSPIRIFIVGSVLTRQKFTVHACLICIWFQRDMTFAKLHVIKIAETRKSFITHNLLQRKNNVYEYLQNVNINVSLEI
jgi:hypothetical protein